MNDNIFTVKLAEVYVQISARDEHMKHFCRKYIEDGDPDFTVEVSEKDIEEERERAVEYFGYGDTSDRELEKLWIYRTIAEKMPSFGVFLMHASAVCVDGQAYLFAGPSGAGKTTQTKLWKEEFQDRMKVINDDKPLIRMTDEDILVCGSPWCGKERWNNNIIAPLCGIIDVEQAEENRIEPMGKVAAWETLMNQLYRSRDPKNMKATLDFADRVISTIPIYSLECNRESEAVAVAFERVSSGACTE